MSRGEPVGSERDNDRPPVEKEEAVGWFRTSLPVKIRRSQKTSKSAQKTDHHVAKLHPAGTRSSNDRRAQHSYNQNMSRNCKSKSAGIWKGPQTRKGTTTDDQELTKVFGSFKWETRPSARFRTDSSSVDEEEDSLSESSPSTEERDVDEGLGQQQDLRSSSEAATVLTNEWEYTPNLPGPDGSSRELPSGADRSLIDDMLREPLVGIEGAIVSSTLFSSTGISGTVSTADLVEQSRSEDELCRHVQSLQTRDGSTSSGMSTGSRRKDAVEAGPCSKIVTKAADSIKDVSDTANGGDVEGTCSGGKDVSAVAGDHKDVEGTGSGGKNVSTGAGHHTDGSSILETSYSDQGCDQMSSPILACITATAKQLEWDSGADIGYDGPKVTYGLSTLEKLAIDSYCSDGKRKELRSRNCCVALMEVANLGDRYRENPAEPVDSSSRPRKFASSKEADLCPKVSLPSLQPSHWSSQGGDTAPTTLAPCNFPTPSLGSRSSASRSSQSLNPLFSTANSEWSRCHAKTFSFQTPVTDEDVSHVNAGPPTELSSQPSCRPNCTEPRSCRTSSRSVPGLSDDRSALSSPTPPTLLPKEGVSADVERPSRKWPDGVVVTTTKTLVDDVCCDADRAKKRQLFTSILEDFGIRLDVGEVLAFFPEEDGGSASTEDGVDVGQRTTEGSFEMGTVAEVSVKMRKGSISGPDVTGTPSNRSSSLDDGQKMQPATVVIKPYRTQSLNYLFYAPVTVRNSAATEWIENRNLEEAVSGPAAELPTPKIEISATSDNSGDTLSLRETITSGTSHTESTQSSRDATVNSDDACHRKTRGITRSGRISPAAKDDSRVYGRGDVGDTVLNSDVLQFETDEGRMALPAETLSGMSTLQSKKLWNESWSSRSWKEVLRSRNKHRLRRWPDRNESTFVTGSSGRSAGPTDVSPSRSHSGTVSPCRGRLQLAKSPPKPPPDSSSNGSSISTGYVRSTSDDESSVLGKPKAPGTPGAIECHYVKELINDQRKHFVKKFQKELEWLERIEKYLATLDGSDRTGTLVSDASLTSDTLEFQRKSDKLKGKRGRRSRRRERKPAGVTCPTSETGATCTTETRSHVTYDDGLRLGHGDLGLRDSAAATAVGHQMDGDRVGDPQTVASGTQTSASAANELLSAEISEMEVPSDRFAKYSSPGN